MEAVSIDSSVWIEALQGKPSALTTRFTTLLEAAAAVTAKPVHIEIMMGVRRDDSPIVQAMFEGTTILTPDESTWNLVDGWISSSERKGQTFGIADLLIAATARQFDLPVWSLDRDFERMEKLGFCTLFRP